MMTVQELLEQLIKLPREAVVYKENEAPDAYYSNTESFVEEIDCSDLPYSITLK